MTRSAHGLSATAELLVTTEPKIAGLSCGANRFRNNSSVYSQLTRVTDGHWTDGQTRTDRRKCHLNTTAFIT